MITQHKQHRGSNLHELWIYFIADPPISVRRVVLKNEHIDIQDTLNYLDSMKNTLHNYMSDLYDKIN